MVYWLVFLLFFCLGCTTEESSSRKKNLKGEHLYRHSDEFFFVPDPPRPIVRKNFPWEDRYLVGPPRITKEFFRCKGNGLNGVIIQKREGKETLYYRDCCGGKNHGLTLREGKEFIYPCLIELLNYVQQKTGKQVIITTGHRCPQHNTYCDYSSSNWGSKHMLGAEVDFYVEGMEEEPGRIIELIQGYYREISPFAGDRRFENFTRYEKLGLNVSTPPWYNKEVFLKLYLASEGRDFDNQHRFPYVCIQVRWDRELESPVTFSPKEIQNYLHDS